MEKIWAVETHGDPLGVLERFFEHIWSEADLDGMIVSTDGVSHPDGCLHVLAHPEQLQNINPFQPVMRANSAGFIPEFLRENEKARFGAVLRPCEMRTLSQLQNLDHIPRGHLVSICMDCLGTFPTSDFEWRAERKGSVDGLAQDSLKFARQGGISVDRYRPACQVCRSPAAEGADINIWVIGLPARQYILVNTSHEEYEERYHFADFPMAPANHDLLDMHQRVLGRVTTRNHLTRDRLVHGLVELLPANLDAIAAQLEKCGDCRDCLDACPICTSSNLRRGTDGKYDRQEVAQWLVSCAGCGMCEQACKKNIPLSAIFGMVREELRAAAG